MGIDGWLEPAVNLTFETGLWPQYRDTRGLRRGGAVRCGAVRIMACIEDPVVIQKILDHLRTKDETCGPFPLPESLVPPGALFG